MPTLISFNDLTYWRLLLVAFAVFISWSGICCSWTKSLRQSLRLIRKPDAYLRSHSTRSGDQGISFSRIISNWSDDSSLMVEFDDQHCTKKDAYGQNDCHYNWGDHVAVNYSIFVNQTLDERAYMEGNFKVDNKVNWRFNCAVCGEDCVFKMPVIDFKYSIPMPDCPVKPLTRAHTMDYDLWKKSPTHGWIGIPLQGEAIVYSQPNEILANIAIDANIK